MENPTNHDILARRVETLLRDDTFSAALNIRLHELQPGCSLVSMPVSPRAMNCHGSAHGGAVWTLADMAFGAAGYYDGPIITTESNLSFLRATPGGSRLFARANQVSRRGKSGVFHIVMGANLDDEAEIFAIGQFAGRWTGLPQRRPAAHSPFDSSQSGAHG
ncbi:PaaI family thioesterase [Nitratireductor sp. CH_MIT9313-5]|uniref:PaaI family thioesterase n=1 Tax=Nitratireductor sp. CH_MIT9313-5 TaxID=3107764 RepID=UPI00300994AF